jgi:hypothetical protein
MPRPRCSIITVFFVFTAFSPSLYAQSHSWLIDGPAFNASPVDIQGAASQSFAWLALFDKDSIQAGQQANLVSKNSSFADLHTLAWLYAAQGKTTEARQFLLDAMAAGNQADPNSAVWFGFGSIYEQLGLNDAAIAAYHMVDVPDGPVSPINTYNLAQAHLKNFHAN